MVAKWKEGIIHADPIGVCWSAFDPADAVLPVIPEVLESPKEQIPLGELTEMYLRVGRSQHKTVVRFATRVESSALWGALRASDQCGLTPDEHAVISTILSIAGGRCTMVSNFPFDGAASRLRGGKQYFEGLMDSGEAASTLRKAGANSRRCSYLPRNAAIVFDHQFPPRTAELASLLRNLGDWCFFTPR